MARELSLNLHPSGNASGDVYDTVVIGAGPGGLSAALYAARAKLRTLVLEKSPRAGALASTGLIANYPGVDEEVSGIELLSRFRRQAERFGAEIAEAQVLSTNLTSDPKEVITSAGTYRGRTVIIASGALERAGSVPGERELVGRGVSYCAACDAAFFQGMDVAVAGNAPEMAAELELIARYARRVYLLPKGKVSEKLLAAARELPNVELFEGAKVAGILGADRVSGVAIVDGTGKRELPVSGAFLYFTGNRPATSFLDRSLALNPDGCIAADPRDGSTNIPGVYAAGDVTCNEVRQAVVAAAQGALAALAAHRHLRQAKRMRLQWN